MWRTGREEGKPVQDASSVLPLLVVTGVWFDQDLLRSLMKSSKELFCPEGQTGALFTGSCPPWSPSWLLDINSLVLLDCYEVPRSCLVTLSGVIASSQMAPVTLAPVSTALGGTSVFLHLYGHSTTYLPSVWCTCKSGRQLSCAAGGYSLSGSFHEPLMSQPPALLGSDASRWRSICWRPVDLILSIICTLSHLVCLQQLGVKFIETEELSAGANTTIWNCNHSI